MAGFWGVKPLFTQLNLNAWVFWIVIFVTAVTFFALVRIIYLICLKKLKRHSITAVDMDNNFRDSTQAIYTSVIAPHYFYGDNLSESVNALKDNSNKKAFFEKMFKKEETFEGVDTVSESCDTRTTPIRPLTPAYQPHEVVLQEDPLGFLSVPPGFVTSLSSNNYLRVERITHSA